jgi:hypothetical protein
MSWLPPYFNSGESMLTSIEIKTQSGDYAKYNFDSNSGSDLIGIGVCTWSVDWFQDSEFNLEINSKPGICCWHVDWIKVWYTGPIRRCTKRAEEVVAPEPEPWVRGDRDMVCYQVWVNDNGCFEFVFWYEYKDNNLVKIYDTKGNEVFSIDMPYGKASFEACLANGTYMVKTFHNDMSEPLQEFLIAK